MSEYIILILHFLKLLLLTLLIGSVFYVVGSISKVCDQGICTATRWVADQGFDVVASILCESPSIHGEVCGRLTENTWKHKKAYDEVMIDWSYDLILVIKLKSNTKKKI